jgi:uncharacterized protein YigE (DUF2233 family)
MEWSFGLGRSGPVRPALLALLTAAGCGRHEPPPLPAGDSAPKPVAAVAVNPLLPCPVDKPILGPGLTVERWPITDAKPATHSTPACIDVVRADPATYSLKILSQATDDATPRTALTWRDAFHLSAVINAGMFHDSGKPVGMIVADGTERSDDNKLMGGYLAFDPVTAGDPPVLVTGRECAGFDLESLRARYHSIVQSYRMLGCDGAAIPWKDPKQYSAAAIGIDRAGRLVFLHTRAAITMAELSASLAGHDLAGALFLEGGPEASLVARGPEGELARVGSFETGFVENDGNVQFWTLPNVIALLPR